MTAASSHTTSDPEPQGLGAAAWSQFVLRLAASAGALVIGSYLGALHDRGVAIAPLAVGLTSALVYVTELLGAPVAGALSDRSGRKVFLVSGPALSMVAVLLIPLGTLGAALPPAGLVLALVGTVRLIEGLGSALTVPAALGFLAEGTEHRPLGRVRQMSLFELATSGGIALGAVLGPLLWQRLHLAAFAVLALCYLAASLVVLRVRAAPRPPARRGAVVDLRRYGALLAQPRLVRFLPAWIAANAIVGVLVTAQLTFLLTARLHVPGQRFVGSLHGHPEQLSAVLGGYVLWFSLCVLAWAVLLGRLPRRRVLLLTACGAVLSSVGLIALNHGGTPMAFIPLVLGGVFLEAGFTPAALAYLADTSQRLARDRGLVMGLYSVILGVGQLAGSALGGVVAQVAYLDGLAYFTMALALVAIVSLVALIQAAPQEQEQQ